MAASYLGVEEPARVGAVGAVLGVFAAAGLVVSRRRETAAVDAQHRSTPLREVDIYDGVTFEHYVQAALRNQGWTVKTTAVTGDFGVDLVASRESRRLAVQCKRSSSAVGVAAVQQVVAGAAHYRCTETMVVTNSYFTTAAQTLARTHRCVLIGRFELAKWVAADA